MQDYIIFSDSSCDLPNKLMQEYDIKVVPFYVSFDKETYLRENIDIQINDFYKKIVQDKIVAKTSLPAIEDYINAFKPYLEEGKDIICFTLCSGLSGSYQSALNAGEILKEEYPERKIVVIDSQNATVAQGLVVIEACKMRQKGLSLEQTVEKIENHKKESLIVFTIDTLEYLQKGGRIGKASALAGSLLNVKPILLFKDGALEPHSKVRGRKKSIAEVLKIFNDAISDDLENYEIAIGHSNCFEEAKELEKTLKEKYGINLSYPIFDIGVTIGAHTGPTTIGLGYVKKFS